MAIFIIKLVKCFITISVTLIFTHIYISEHIAVEISEDNWF